MFRLFSPLWCVLLLSLLTVRAANCAPNNPDPVTNTFGPATKSYGEQLAEKKFFDVFLPAVAAARPGMLPTAPGWHLMEIGNTAKFYQLTPWQQLQLAGWIIPAGGYVNTVVPSSGRPITTADTFMLYRHFVMEQGRPPIDAADIFDKSLSLMSSAEAKEHFETIFRGDPTKLPNYFLSLINPQTMQLYASFDGSIHEPGGLIFRKIETIDEAREMVASHNAQGLVTERYAGAYEVKVQGPKPGEILDSGFIIMNH
jgi:hypothetical protein